MKKQLLNFLTTLFSIAMFLVFENCGTTEEEKPNKAPSCNITNPANNEVISLGTTVKITVSATDTDGSIANVKISIDGTTVATLKTSPYTYDWNTSGAASGSHIIKAVATDDGGLTAMSQVTVELTALAPTVTTADITDITGNSAKGGGTVTDNGGAEVTARGVVWAETSGPTTESNSGMTADGTGTGAFMSTLTGLAANTTYYVRAYATNGSGTAYGEEKSFVTAGLPVLEMTNVDPNKITHNSAECIAEITSDGGSAVTVRGFVWAREDVEPNPTLDNNEGSIEAGSGTGTFTATISLASAKTFYYVRPYATNSAGTSYGTGWRFETKEGPPAVTTGDVTGITAHTAVCPITITDDGGAATLTKGVVWSTTPNPDHQNNEGFFQYDTWDTGMSFDVPVTALKENTTYYAKAFVINNTGIGYGAEKTFTTKSFTIQTGTYTDSRDSKVYKTVSIFGLTWIAENLAYLPEVCAPDAECGYWVYDYNGTDVTAAKATANYTDYGVLYNWEMAKTSCPAGWHLPTTEEWSMLELLIGMSHFDAFFMGNQRGSNEGDKLKEKGTTYWITGNTGTNITGFNARGTGRRDETNKNFIEIKAQTRFWTATSLSGNITYRDIGCCNPKIAMSRAQIPNQGNPVRCVKD